MMSTISDFLSNMLSNICFDSYKIIFSINALEHLSNQLQIRILVLNIIANP